MCSEIVLMTSWYRSYDLLVICLLQLTVFVVQLDVSAAGLLGIYGSKVLPSGLLLFIDFGSSLCTVSKSA